MERKEAQNKENLDSAFSILELLSNGRVQIEGPGEDGRYSIRGPEGAEGLLEALEGLEALRVPSERLGKDLRRFLKEHDLTGGGLLLLAGLRLFFIRQEGPDAYGILMDRRFQETVPLPEVRLEHLIAALRHLNGQEARQPPIEGKVFVLAGGLSREDRSRAKELITVRGGRCATSLSGRTDYLAAGTAEALRENTMMQVQALQAKGRELYLLDRRSLFSLLGEAPQDDALSLESEQTAAKESPGLEKVPAAREEEGPSISGNTEESAFKEEKRAPAEVLTESSKPAASPEHPSESKAIAAEGIEATLEQSWNDAWMSRQEQEARALAEAEAEVKRLQEARAAGERRLQGLGLLKFSERAAVRQELQRLNQSLRTAEAELTRLKRSAT